MIAVLAREFVLVFEAIAEAFGCAAALADRAVQAARVRWLRARGAFA